MLAYHGWIYVLAGLAMATLVAIAIPYAARRSQS